MKIRTAEMLCDRVAQDLSWRKKELTALRDLITLPSVSVPRKRVVSRSGITLLYAHWEGFVKKASLYYLEFVRMQRLKNFELAPNFVSLIMCQQMGRSQNSKKPSQYEWIIDFFTNQQEDRAVFAYKDAVDTESNLSARVFKEIMWTLGLDYSFFEPLEKLIDATLLGKRNAVAHGENEPVDQFDYLFLHDRVIEMMNFFKNQLENAAVTGAYKRCIV
ncbi:MAG: hypothetical protein H7Y09_03115 [Chitinophagaceae bacterium]|nr:hypothetical protein [Anaerolineae bacterium]